MSFNLAISEYCKRHLVSLENRVNKMLEVSFYHKKKIKIRKN